MSQASYCITCGEPWDGHTIVPEEADQARVCYQQLAEKRIAELADALRIYANPLAWKAGNIYVPGVAEPLPWALIDRGARARDVLGEEFSE